MSFRRAGCVLALGSPTERMQRLALAVGRAPSAARLPACAGVGIFGTKAGMTQYFKDGLAIPATVIALEAGNIVTQVLTAEKDGYTAVQVGYRATKERKITKPELGHCKKAGAPPLKHLREFKVRVAASHNAMRWPVAWSRWPDRRTRPLARRPATPVGTPRRGPHYCAGGRRLWVRARPAAGRV